jgi:uncharacterized protein YciI
LGGIVSPILVGRIKDVTGSATNALYIISALSLAAATALAAFAPQQLRNDD